jgi:two-component system, cell cycle response regulator
MTGAAGEPLTEPRLLLDGDASARPDGLERALTRAGFHIGEVAPAPHETPPDALLTTLETADPERLAAVLAHTATEPPRVLVFASEDRDAPAAALALGAADALAAPVHLPELCARLMARIRERQSPTGTPHEARVRESLRDFVQQARAGLQPDEVAQALVRRLGRALGLAHCSFVVTRPGEDAGHVIADFSDGRSEHARLDLARYPEIVQAVRGRRTIAMPDRHGGASGDAPVVVMPVVVDEVVAGVLLMRGPDSAPGLSAAQLGLAGSLAEAAARSLDGGRPANGGPRLPPPATLDRRLQEELERARRYSLTFSLVLLHQDDALAPEDTDPVAEARERQELVGRIRGELRLPDFVSSYGGDELALVLPETGADGARRWVVRIRERLNGMAAGIVAYPHPSVAVPDDLLALVEAALRRGRAQAGVRIGVAE